MGEPEHETSLETHLGFNLGVVSGDLTRKVVQRWATRAESLPHEAASLAGMTLEEFLGHIDSDERLQDMLLGAMRAAARSSMEAKRRGLARAVANGALAKDDAAIDGWAVALSVLERLEAPHLRVLVHLE